MEDQAIPIPKPPPNHWAARSVEDGCPVPTLIRYPNYRTYGKITQMTKPGPSMTWVIMDENPLSINDACMQMSMAQILVDFPGNYHNGGAGISFADGHTEMHKWTDDFAQTLPTGGPVPGQGSTAQPVPPSHDLAWIQPRTSALK